MEDILRIGVITSTHGLKGEVKVYPTTDDVGRFKKLKKCIIRTEKGEDIEVEKNSCKFFKNMVILSFKEFNNINEVEKYKGSELYVTRDAAIPLEEDEFFISDVIGADIYLEDGSHFGKLKDVMKTGANDVFVITMDDKQELLVPVIKEFVPEMDILNKKITIKLMKGMLD